VLLTDGQVSNEPAILKLAKRHRSRNRLFTFGIGSSASAFLVNGLARVSGGAAEFIAPGERIEDKVLRTFGRIASPPVSDVEIDWGNADADAAPRPLPPLFDGDALRVFARIPGKLPETVALKCNTPAGPRSWSVPVRDAPDPAGVLPSLWARAMIRALEEEDGVQQSATTITARSAKGKQLIDLSKRYNLLCCLTSFIAIEHRSLEDRNEGKPELRRVPVMLAAGWGGVEALADRSVDAGSLMSSMPAPAQFLSLAPAPPAARGGGAPAGAGMAAAFGLVRRAFGGGTPPPAQASEAESLAPTDPLIQLLARQDAHGSFESVSAAELRTWAARFDVGAMLNAIDELFDQAKLPAAPRSKIRQTLLVLLVLRLTFAGRQATWNRAFKKAVQWITAEAALPAGQAQTWVDNLKLKFGKGG
jgi:Ca-activated chloride channel family protein